MKTALITFCLLLATAACSREEEFSQKIEDEGGRESQAQVAQTEEAANGRRIYKEVCATCHEEGIAGAPRLDNPEAWKSRIAKGMETLIYNSIEGYQGNRGFMPPKGGAASLSDEEVKAAVAYMVKQAQQGS